VRSAAEFAGGDIVQALLGGPGLGGARDGPFEEALVMSAGVLRPAALEVDFAEVIVDRRHLGGDFDELEVVLLGLVEAAEA
jgi:hypothetical protein